MERAANGSQQELTDEDAIRIEEETGSPPPGFLPANANIAYRNQNESLSSYIPPEYLHHSMDWVDLEANDEEGEALQSFYKKTDERTMPVDKRVAYSS